MDVRRFGQLIKLKPEKLEYYKELHANPWQCVVDKIRECNIRNYSIYLTPANELFAYFEYVGNDFDADMKKIATDECTQKWWKETGPCQETISNKENQWWLNLEEVFHVD